MNSFRKTINDFLRFVSESGYHVPEREVESQWDAIVERVRLERRRLLLRRVWYSLGAASLAGVIAVTFLLTNGVDRRSEIERFASRTIPEYSVQDTVAIKLVIAGGSDMEISGNEASVNHDVEGKVTVNDEAVEPADRESHDFNQLIVPYGRRSRLTLADGSCLWINSGSRVVYPSRFDGERREVYLEGEAYLEVAADREHPFIVRTQGMEVLVTGTRFNVFAYPGESHAEVALAQGGVTVSTPSSRQQLTPGHLVKTTADGRVSTPEQADIAARTSWVTNTLVYDYEPLPAVLDRLELYYGRSFVIDGDISDLRISGKLDMPHRLEPVLDAISFSVPVTFDDRADGIHVSKATQQIEF